MKPKKKVRVYDLTEYEHEVLMVPVLKRGVASLIPTQLRITPRRNPVEPVRLPLRMK